MPGIFTQQINGFDQFRTHQHSGYDGSQRIALLDWKEIGRTELAVAATSLTLLNLSARRFMRALIQFDAKSGASDNYIRFNGDSAANYTFIDDINAIARTSQAQIDISDGANVADGYFVIMDIVNVSGLVKCTDVVSIRRITAASTVQTRSRVAGTWINTSAAINRIDLISSNTQTYPIGTQMVVYGCNFA